MDFLPVLINQYVESKTAKEPEVLAELSRETHLKVLYPRMLSGHLQGRFLSFFSRILRPKRVLEIGTYTGYSCICLAEGLQKGGKIVTIDINPELEDIIVPYLTKAGIREQVELKFGNAMDIVPQIEEELDLVFIDADKHNYLSYYKMVVPKLRKGGFILADNVLWSGKVADEKYQDKETQGIRMFNDFVSKDKRVEQMLLPLRDGIMIIQKR